MWQNYYQPASLAAALDLLHTHAGRARLVAGGTDVIIELQRGTRPTETLIDLTLLGHELRYVRADGDQIVLGGLATHNDVLASEICRDGALPLVQACLEVGAPQIRTRATVAGNLVTASPANDTITPLIALDADLVLVSRAGERVVPLREFYRGVRRTLLQPDELVREIRFAALRADQRGLFLKLGLRRAQAISVINLALVLDFDGDVVRRARVALGCLAPTIVRAPSAEAYLVGRTLDEATRAETGRLACQDVRPIGDLRGSAEYRLATLASLVGDGLRQLAAGTQAAMLPAAPVLLDTGIVRTVGSSGSHHGGTPLAVRAAGSDFTGVIDTTINGRQYRLSGAQGKTLLDALREDAGLTGTKEGCAEGECGACTVWLDGQAVMSCLVPAPQAHNASLTTIEGLCDSDALHPLQAAFIAHGAVQCGFCIPGMLMAGAKLLDEHPRPDWSQARTAISGNICRCTGYRTILDAVQDAAGASR